MCHHRSPLFACVTLCQHPELFQASSGWWHLAPAAVPGQCSVTALSPAGHCCCPWGSATALFQQDSAVLQGNLQFVQLSVGEGLSQPLAGLFTPSLGVCVSAVTWRSCLRSLLQGFPVPSGAQGCPPSSVLTPNPFQRRSTGPIFPSRRPRGELPVLRAGIVLDN